MAAEYAIVGLKVAREEREPRLRIVVARGHAEIGGHDPPHLIVFFVELNFATHQRPIRAQTATPHEGGTYAHDRENVGGDALHKCDLGGVARVDGDGLVAKKSGSGERSSPAHEVEDIAGCDAACGLASAFERILVDDDEARGVAVRK